MTDKLYALLLLFLSLTSHSQNNQDKYTNQIINSEYYLLQRENIHLHLNKNIYLNDETIWFKGYIIDKTEGLLNNETSNVYVSILNSKKEIISTKLFLANSGIIIGQLDLNTNYESGKYYIHTFTNYMNNFEEDESSYFPIEIINKKDKITIQKLNNAENISIDFTIEGGTFIAGCNTKIGVLIKDCRGNGLLTKDIKIIDNKNNILSTFSTNQYGYGVFKVIGINNQIYKISLEIDGNKFEKLLPIPQENGININVENHLIEKETIEIEINTNQNTLSNIKNKDYKLIIQKNDQIGIIDYKIEKTTSKIELKKKNLFNGINYLRLIDSKNNLISERIIYNHVNNASNILLERKSVINDSIIISGKLKDRVGNFSISILPQESISSFENNSIYSQFLIKNQLKKPLENISLNKFSKITEEDLDLYLLFEKEIKYNWSNFLTKKPNNTFEFEKGLNLKVTVNQTLSNKSQYTANLISTNNSQFFKEKMSKSNSFDFKNVIAKDSTEMIFSLEKDEKSLYEKINIYSVITNSKKRFFKSYLESESNYPCQDKIYTRLLDENIDFVIGDKSKKIEEILIQKKLDKLDHIDEIGNKNARVLKIDPKKNNKTLIQIIRENGYNVERESLDYKVYNYGRDGRGELTSPTIFLNGMVVNDLFMIDESSINEIYFNKYDINDSRYGNVGTIKIYSKQDYSNIKDKENGTKIIKILKGFEQQRDYTNQYVSGFQKIGFKKYGTIDWLPNINTDLNGNFEFKISKLEQENIIINIQGIDNLGNFYFENFVINLN